MRKLILFFFCSLLALPPARGQTTYKYANAFHDFTSGGIGLPMVISDPSGSCAPAGRQVWSLASHKPWTCESLTWVPSASGSGYAYDQSFVLDRFYQIANYGNRLTNATPFFQRTYLDPGTTATPGYADAYGARYFCGSYTGFNLQLGGKTTTHCWREESQLGTGQSAHRAIVVSKPDEGDGTIEDVVWDYLNGGNTPGDEGGPFGRYQIMNSGARTQKTIGSIDTPSTCATTLVTSAIAPLQDNSGGSNGKQNVTANVNSNSGCAVGEVLHIDAPPNFSQPGAAQNHWCTTGRTGGTQETCSSGQSYIEEEFAQITATGTGTITARFFAPHLANAPVRTTMVIRPAATGDFNKVGTKMLVVNTEASKQYSTGTISSTGNGNTFTLTGGTWSATMFGGDSSFPGMCIAPADDHSGNTQDSNVWDAWQEVATVPTSTTLTLRATQHYNVLTNSAYKLAPCTSVEKKLLDGSGNISGLVLRNQTLNNTYKFAAGDHIEIAADPTNGNPTFMNVLCFPGFPFGTACGIGFKNKGRGVGSSISFAADNYNYANGKPRPGFNGFLNADDAQIPYYTGIAINLSSRNIGSPSRGFSSDMSAIVLKTFQSDSTDGIDTKKIDWVTNTGGKHLMIGQDPTNGHVQWSYDGSGYTGGKFRYDDNSFQVHNLFHVMGYNGTVGLKVHTGDRNGPSDGNSTDLTYAEIVAEGSNSNIDIQATPKGTGSFKATHLQHVATSSDPGCSTTAHIGRVWVDNSSSTTTAYKVCLATSGTAGWVTK